VGYDDYRNVHVTVQDRIAVLAIDHPPVNTLDAATFLDLSTAFDAAMADVAVKVIIITGTGKSFIAGADVNELCAIASVEEAKDKAEAGHSLFRRIERACKPVIAAINGRYCLGGGSELALACHIRIAEERVKFAQPEIKLGLIPGWGATQRLIRLVGLGKATELILTGEHIRADEAYRIGLVNKVVPEGTALQEALRMAGRMASLSSLALAKALDAIYAGLNMSLDEGLAYEAACFSEMAATEDMREGLNAFIEKRTPEFKDR
jgi:enoyl-CoA hydratase/carnithine racemase